MNYLGRLNSIKEHFASLKNNCQIEHLDVPFEPKNSLFNRAVHGSLKILQEQFLQSDCTHFVTIESDVIAPPNLLELFCEVLDKGADMIGGLYYNYTIHTKEDYENDDFVFSGGELTGCTCFSRKILEKIKFRQGDDLGCFPDSYFSLDAAANGFKLGRYRKIKCNHLDDGSGFRGHSDYITL